MEGQIEEPTQPLTESSELNGTEANPVSEVAEDAPQAPAALKKFNAHYWVQKPGGFGRMIDEEVEAVSEEAVEESIRVKHRGHWVKDVVIVEV